MGEGSSGRAFLTLYNPSHKIESWSSVAIVTGIFEHSNHLRLKIGGGGKQKKLLTFVCDVLWIPNIAESFWWSNSPSRNCVSKIAKYAHFCRKNHNMNKRASKFCTFFRPFVHFWENLYISLFVSNRNRSPALSILCTAIQHGKMPQVGIGTKILECLYL